MRKKKNVLKIISAPSCRGK